MMRRIDSPPVPVRTQRDLGFEIRGLIGSAQIAQRDDIAAGFAAGQKQQLSKLGVIR
jgi:hypothetical protein